MLPPAYDVIYTQSPTFAGVIKQCELLMMKFKLLRIKRYIKFKRTVTVEMPYFLEIPLCAMNNCFKQSYHLLKITRNRICVMRLAKTFLLPAFTIDDFIRLSFLGHRPVCIVARAPLPGKLEILLKAFAEATNLFFLTAL